MASQTNGNYGGVQHGTNPDQCFAEVPHPDLGIRPGVDADSGLETKCRTPRNQQPHSSLTRLTMSRMATDGKYRGPHRAHHGDCSQMLVPVSAPLGVTGTPMYEGPDKSSRSRNDMPSPRVPAGSPTGQDGEQNRRFRWRSHVGDTG